MNSQTAFIDACKNNRLKNNLSSPYERRTIKITRDILMLFRILLILLIITLSIHAETIQGKVIGIMDVFASIKL